MNALLDCWGNVDSISPFFSFSFQNYIFIIASFAKLAEYEEKKKKVFLYINKNDCMLCGICSILGFQENRKK